MTSAEIQKSHDLLDYGNAWRGGEGLTSMGAIRTHPLALANKNLCIKRGELHSMEAVRKASRKQARLKMKAVIRAHVAEAKGKHA